MMKSIDRLLIKILAISALLFLLSLIFSNKDKNTQKSAESALLNLKYKNDVAKIEISKSGGAEDGGTITLTKQGDFWLLSKEDEKGETICVIADSKIIGSLIENAVKIRKIYAISEKISDYERLGLTENLSTSISFLKNDNNLYTKVHFGHSDSLKNRIYFRSEASKITYECENDFQQYLTAETNYWSEGKILPEIKNPVQISFKTNESSVGQPSKTITLDEKSQEFISKSKALLSLRHGKIWPETTINSENYILTLTVQDGSGRIAKLDFFKIQKGDDESYFYRKSIQPSTVDSQENIFAFYSEKAAYEISAWTYEKIIQTVLTAE